MKKIAILSCKMIRSQNLCPADTRCLVALSRKEGEFERYKDEDVALLGIMDCGGCEGNETRAICSLVLLKMQLAALKENIDVLHIGTCMMTFCPRRDDIIAAVKVKAGVEIVGGTHKYAPPTIFGS